MRNILILLVMMIALSFETHGVIFDDDQETAFLGLGENSVAGSVLPVQLDNSTLSEIQSLSFSDKPIYLTFYGLEANNSFQISYNDGTGAVVNNYNFSAGETLYLSFEPSFPSEKVDIIISAIQGQINYEITVFNNDDRGNSFSIFAPVIDGVVELIAININMWKIVYYVFITVIFLVVIAGVFYLGYQVTRFNKTLDNSQSGMFGSKRE